MSHKPNSVTTATQLNGMPVVVLLKKSQPETIITCGVADQVIGTASEVTAQGILVITGERGSISMFIPWNNIAYVRHDAANAPDVSDFSSSVPVEGHIS